MAFNHITFKKENKTATITLNTPPSNWLTISMMKEINEVLLDVKKDASSRCLFLIMRGKRPSVMVSMWLITRKTK